MGLNDDINNIYLQFNRPSSVAKLYKLVKAAGITATNKDVKSFLDSKVAIQQTKIVNKNKNDLGHPVSIWLQLQKIPCPKLRNFFSGVIYAFS